MHSLASRLPTAYSFKMFFLFYFTLCLPPGLFESHFDGDWSIPCVCTNFWFIRPPNILLIPFSGRKDFFSSQNSERAEDMSPIETLEYISQQCSLYKSGYILLKHTELSNTYFAFYKFFIAHMVTHLFVSPQQPFDKWTHINYSL